jgi:hypothetical protein
MKKFVLFTAFLFSACGTRAFAQSTDSLVYSLVNHTTNLYIENLGWRYLVDNFFTDLPEEIDFDSAYHAQKK